MIEFILGAIIGGTISFIMCCFLVTASKEDEVEDDYYDF